MGIKRLNLAILTGKYVEAAFFHHIMNAELMVQDVRSIPA